MPRIVHYDRSVVWLALATAAISISALTPGCRRTSQSSEDPPNGATATADHWFEDATDRVGLIFAHVAGSGKSYFMPDQMGSGAALFDVNGDDRLDVYLIQNGGRESTAPNQLYLQEKDGTFRNASPGSGTDVAGHGMGAATGDVNNDGRIDLLVTEYGGLHLFLNQGEGRFVDITQKAGLDNPHWGTSAAFFDFNRDGWLDLVVANYLDYNSDQKCADSMGQPEFCGPHGFPGVVTKLFKNLGGARFQDISIISGVARHPGPALGVVCADFNGDRWPDIFLADDGRPNRLFINQTDETFLEEAAVRGLAYTAMGQTAGDMGVTIGDIDENGLFDVFATHLAQERHSLWMQGPTGMFQDRAAARGLNQEGWRGTGFGAALVDFDLDGDLDLAFVNGRVKRGRQPPPSQANATSFWSSYAQRPQLFGNQGSGQFIDLSEANPSFTDQLMVGRGLACGDLDNDGDVDLLLTGTAGTARLLYNVAPRNGHWLSLRIVAPELGGRDAIGAEVTVSSGEHHWWRLAHPAFSYLSSHDPRVHVGLGQEEGYDSIQVIWPDGLVEVFSGGPADRFITLRRGEGASQLP